MVLEIQSHGILQSHTATIELPSWQNLAVTNEIGAVCRLHPLSWSNYVLYLADVSILSSNGTA